MEPMEGHTMAKEKSQLWAHANVFAEGRQDIWVGAASGGLAKILPLNLCDISRTVHPDGDHVREHMQEAWLV